MINDVRTSLSGLSLIGRGFFFAPPGVGGSPSNDGLGEGFFFAFSSLRAFNESKTRVNPEGVVVVLVVVPRRLTEEEEEESAASFIPASSVIAPSVLVHSSYRKVKDFYMPIKKKNICDISSKDTNKDDLADVGVEDFNTCICQSLLHQENVISLENGLEIA